MPKSEGASKLPRIWELDEPTRCFIKLSLRRVSIPEARVLLTLAYRGPANMYQISTRAVKGKARAPKTTYPAVHGAIKSLKKLGWVKVVDEGKSRKNNPAKTYGLTVEGLLWLFARFPSITHPERLHDESVGLKMMNQKQPKEVEKTHGDQDSYFLFHFDFYSVRKKNVALLPIVFEKWERFQEFHSANDLMWNFPGVAQETLLEYHVGHEGLRERLKSMEMIFAYKLFYSYLENTSRFYGIPRPSFLEFRKHAGEYIKKIAVETLTSSPQLAKLAHQILRDMKTQVDWKREIIDDSEAAIARFVSTNNTK
jgi:predicted transcriptional regulator